MKVAHLKKLETGITILLLLYFSGGMGPNPLGKLLQPLSYPILLVLITVRWKRFVSVLTKDIPLLLLVLLAPISVIWSVSPDDTIAYGKGVLRSTFFGAYLATRYPLKQQLKLLTIVFGISVLLSLFYGVISPSEGVHQHGPHKGLWKGSYSHKNIMGRAMNLSAEIFLLQALSSSNWYRYLLWTGAGLSVILVLLSGSATALGTLLLVSSLLPVYRFLQRRHYKLQVLILIFLVFMGVSIGTIIVINAATLAASQGKDLTFSGRTPLWGFLNQLIAEKPFIGYGYEAFWPSQGDLVSRVQNWEITHAHNGFYDLMLSLGLLGFVLYLLSWLPFLSRSVYEMYLADKAIDFFPLQFLVFNMIVEITIEGSILSATSIFWIVYASTAFSLACRKK